MDLFYCLNDNLIELDGLTNEATGAYVNDATVNCTLKDTAGVDIVGETWPLLMGYVSGSNGKYRATLEDTLTVTPGQYIVAYVDALGDGLKGRWVSRVPVVDRDFDA